ncbi:MAG: hypothetical protein C5B50_00970 [Verrucomicrobia bacterium]|nr:MAG: hypothetical protein C5B50_00970 [Verrucomicrobiota bacterium]
MAVAGGAEPREEVGSTRVGADPSGISEDSFLGASGTRIERGSDGKTFEESDGFTITGGEHKMPFLSMRKPHQSRYDRETGARAGLHGRGFGLGEGGFAFGLWGEPGWEIDAVMFVPIENGGELLGGEAVGGFGTIAITAMDMPAIKFVAEVGPARVDQVGMGIIRQRVHVEEVGADDFGLAHMVREAWIWKNAAVG